MAKKVRKTAGQMMISLLCLSGIRWDYYLPVHRMGSITPINIGRALFLPLRFIFDAFEVPFRWIVT